MQLADPLLDTFVSLVSFLDSSLAGSQGRIGRRERLEGILTSAGMEGERLVAVLGLYDERRERDRTTSLGALAAMRSRLPDTDAEFLLYAAVHLLSPLSPDHGESSVLPDSEVEDLVEAFALQRSDWDAAVSLISKSGIGATCQGSGSLRILDLSKLQPNQSRAGTALLAWTGRGNRIVLDGEKGAGLRRLRSFESLTVSGKEFATVDLDLYFRINEGDELSIPKCFFLSRPRDGSRGNVISEEAPTARRGIAFTRDGCRFSCSILDPDASAADPATWRAITLADSIRIGEEKIAFRQVVQLILDRAGVGRLIGDLEVSSVSYSLPDGKRLLDRISFASRFGRLVAIVGPSGCGKSTLLGLLSGDGETDSGTISADGRCPGELARTGLLSFVPQDDILYGNLTVAETLDFGLRLRRPDLPRSLREPVVMRVLEETGLADRSGTRVGDPDSKTLSGGQRKRVNIGLELLTEPSLCLLDEPTSGLSSADALLVADVLKRRADAGALVLVVLHQPGQSLLARFDDLLVLDEGGKLAWFGPVSRSEEWFRPFAGEARHRYASTTEFIFETLQQKQRRIDGARGEGRRFPPEFWQARFRTERTAVLPLAASMRSAPEATSLSSRETDRGRRGASICAALLHRECLQRLRNRSQLAVSLLSALLLGVIAAWSCRDLSQAPAGEGYAYFRNPALSHFCFLSVVITLFFGISAGVHEIVRERLVRQREARLGVPAYLYLTGKIVPSHVLLCLQVGIYLAVSFFILEIPEAFWGWWAFLAGPVGFSALGLGYFISSLPGLSERAATAAIPILLIPQIILAGAEPFPFSRMQHLRFFPPLDPVAIGEGSRDSPVPPMIAQVALSRWAYEGIVTLHRDGTHAGRVDAARSRLAGTTGNFGEVQVILRGLLRDSPDLGAIGKLYLEKSGNELSRERLDDFALVKASEATPETWPLLPEWIRQRASPSGRLIPANFMMGARRDFPSKRSLPWGEGEIAPAFYASLVLTGFGGVFFAICLWNLVKPMGARRRRSSGFRAVPQPSVKPSP